MLAPPRKMSNLATNDKICTLTSNLTANHSTFFLLQVLDLGFNLLRSIPDTAFTGIQSLTLLAVDGNPMASLPEAAFTHLNASLKGLSVGGRFLTCDCRQA